MKHDMSIEERARAEYNAGHSDGESCRNNDWVHALTEIAAIPDEIAELGPVGFALWLDETWPPTSRPVT